MEVRHIGIYFLFYFLNCVHSQDLPGRNDDLMTTKVSYLEPANFVNWPNGTIPFYINNEHFDNEQSQIIMTSLSLLAFKTCLKFTPVMVPPQENQHVLAFVNPSGVRKCELLQAGHGGTEPHVVELGYNCLQAPWMDRVVLRALGLPFEHNRANRDQYIDVQYENIEQNEFPLFTKDYRLPAALRALPYDVNSVMHFGDRDFSKNGHRTIIFKDRNTKQKWEGLTDLDLRKIRIIYGPECTKRDRQEKVDLCHQYPGIPPINRRKRSLDTSSKSLRVNRDITLPPEQTTRLSSKIEAVLNALDIEEEVQNILDAVFKLSNKALSNARKKYCNATEALRSSSDKSDVLGVIEVITDYAESVVEMATRELSAFCERSESVEAYQRQRCPDGCYRQYFSTKVNLPFPSTKNWEIRQSTHLAGHEKRPYGRAGNQTDQKQMVPEVNEDVAVKVERVKRGAREGKRRRIIREETDSSSDYEQPSSNERKRKQRKPVTHHRLGSDEINHDGDSKENKQLTDDDDTKRKQRKPVTHHRLGSDEINHDGDSKENKQLTDDDDTKPEQAKRPVKSKEINEDDGGKGAELESDGGKPKKIKLPEKSEETVPEDDFAADKGIASNEESSMPKIVTLSKKNKEFYKQRRWPHGIVYYIIDEHCTEFDVADLRRRIAEVNAILRKRTCARIAELSARDSNKYADYLVLDNSPDFVTGRVGGRQLFGSAELLVGGQHRQHTAMMVMAMLGFYFELSRHDRDKYVKVHSRHIRPDKLHHFEKIGDDATLPLPYDYESATHPAWMFWRQLGHKGISTVATYKDKDPDGSIMKSFGQHEKLLSEGDIIKINSIYGTKCMGSKTVN